MSAKKVNQYKAQKKNRKQELRANKRDAILSRAVTALIIIFLIAASGIVLYQIFAGGQPAASIAPTITTTSVTQEDESNVLVANEQNAGIVVSTDSNGGIVLEDEADGAAAESASTSSASSNSK